MMYGYGDLKIMVDQGIEKRPVGRPQGTKEDPVSMLQRDLSQTLKLQKQLRDTIEEQLARIEKRLASENTTLKDRLEGVEVLTRAMEALTKSVQQSSAGLMRLKDASASPEAEMGEEELREMIFGRGRS